MASTWDLANYDYTVLLYLNSLAIYPCGPDPACGGDYTREDVYQRHVFGNC